MGRRGAMSKRAEPLDSGSTVTINVLSTAVSAGPHAAGSAAGSATRGTTPDIVSAGCVANLTVVTVQPSGSVSEVR